MAFWHICDINVKLRSELLCLLYALGYAVDCNVLLDAFNVDIKEQSLDLRTGALLKAVSCLQLMLGMWGRIIVQITSSNIIVPIVVLGTIILGETNK